MPRILLACTLLVAGCVVQPPEKTGAAQSLPPGQRAKNVILFVGDGMGPGQMGLGILYRQLRRPQDEKLAPRAYDIALSVGWIADRLEGRGGMVDREDRTATQGEGVERYDSLATRGSDEFGVSRSSSQKIVRR